MFVRGVKVKTRTAENGAQWEPEKTYLDIFDAVFLGILLMFE